MADMLNMRHINSLPHPLSARSLGNKEYWWPVEQICVETGCMTIDVCGKAENKHIGDVGMFRDSAGFEHDPDSFYADYEQEKN